MTGAILRTLEILANTKIRLANVATLPSSDTLLLVYTLSYR